MTNMPGLVDVVAIDNMLGEGVQWNDEDGCAWWTGLPMRGSCIASDGQIAPTTASQRRNESAPLPSSSTAVT